MAVCADGNPACGPGRGRLSWPVLLLTLAAVTSSSLSALCLYQLLTLRAEVEGLKSDIYRRREEQQEAKQARQPLEQMGSGRDSPEPPGQPQSQPDLPLMRKMRSAPGAETPVSQPCLQLLADSSRQTFEKVFDSDPHTAIPWQAGLQRGSALVMEGDSIVVREEGFYFVYSQVYYMDRMFTMGHVVIRRKRNVVGDEAQHVILFRCIQSMDRTHPFNTCYTGGIVKLDVGDQVELLIPRSPANVCLEGDSTFLGCIRLA